MRIKKRNVLTSFTLTDENLDKLEILASMGENNCNKSLTIRNLIDKAYSKITKKDENMGK